MFTWTALHSVALGSVLVACIVARRLRSSRRRGNPLPPGPPGLPWVGNVIGIDASAPWITYNKWAKTYGDLMYSRILGQEIIIINSEKVARELLERRSRNYADRPHLIVNELCGIELNTGLIPYGDAWRLHRRFFHSTFGSRDAVSRFQPLQYDKGCRLLQQLLETPKRFSEHALDYTSSLILNSVYAYDPPSREDEVAQAVTKVLDVISPALRPETALLVGAFPAVLYLPSWLPGMSFKKEMEAAKKCAEQYVEQPFKYAMQKLSESGSTPSMAHDSLKNVESGFDKESMTKLKWAASSAFLAGAETSTSAVILFFLMMTLHPHVQEKAQAQIDLVVGRERLPTLHDRASLPCVDAIFRELLRYHPALPLSVPRSVVDDDVYNGFHIPKGATVLINHWAMAHDESKYPRPHEFIPERHLNDDGSLLPDTTENLAYGFGRRTCPGKYFADTSVWSAIACILAVFNISKAKDDNGVEISVVPEFGGGLTVHPLPFVCDIVPRIAGMDLQQLEKLVTVSSV